LEALKDQLLKYLRLDIERLVLHNVNLQHEAFIEDFQAIANDLH